MSVWRGAGRAGRPRTQGNPTPSPPCLGAPTRFPRVEASGWGGWSGDTREKQIKSRQSQDLEDPAKAGDGTTRGPGTGLGYGVRPTGQVGLEGNRGPLPTSPGPRPLAAPPAAAEKPRLPRAAPAPPPASRRGAALLPPASRGRLDATTDAKYRGLLGGPRRGASRPEPSRHQSCVCRNNKQ